MREFARLFHHLDSTSNTPARIEAITNYLNTTDERSAMHAIAIMLGRRPKRTATTRSMRKWATEVTGIPDWLFEESYQMVGDLGETISLILPAHRESETKPLHYWMDFLAEMQQMEKEGKKERIVEAWRELGQEELYVFCKLVAGGWRFGVKAKTLTQAIALFSGRDINVVAHRLQGDWNAYDTSLTQLLEESATDKDSRPYPFHTSYSLDLTPEEIGDIGEWSAELKWEGIRGQVIYRGGELYVWDRREELVTHKFPEYSALRSCLPEGTVIDGEILCYKDEEPLPLQLLENRMGRKSIGKKTLEQAPVCLMAYDLLECNGEDIRHRPLQVRRILLEEIVNQAAHPVLQLSDSVEAESWQELRELWEEARLMRCSGVMLKRKDSPYRSGRHRGDWWKWKVKPILVNAVLIYATRGQRGQAGSFDDLTFAVWKEDQLVPFAKVSQGLTPQEREEIALFVKNNTIERFGPVQSVSPEIVMEIAFENISRSSRHKSGVMVRSSRITRIRRDIPSRKAHSLQDLMSILESIGQ